MVLLLLLNVSNLSLLTVYQIQLLHFILFVTCFPNFRRSSDCFVPCSGRNVLFKTLAKNICCNEVNVIWCWTFYFFCKYCFRFYCFLILNVDTSSTEISNWLQSTAIILLISDDGRKYSSRFRLEFAMTFVPLSTFNARFSCSIPRFVRIDINGTFIVSNAKTRFLHHSPCSFFILFPLRALFVNNLSCRIWWNTNITVEIYINAILSRRSGV